MQFRRGATHYHGRGGGAAGAKDSHLRSGSGPGHPSGQLRSAPRRSPGPCPRLLIGTAEQPMMRSCLSGPSILLCSLLSPPVWSVRSVGGRGNALETVHGRPVAFPNAGASALGRRGTPSRPVHGRASGMDRSTRSGSRLAGGSEVLLGYGRREPTSEAVSSRRGPPHPRRPVVVAFRSRDPHEASSACLSSLAWDRSCPLRCFATPIGHSCLASGLQVPA